MSETTPSLTVTESPAPASRWSGTVRRTCNVCERSFYAHPSQVKKGRAKFCSRPCSDIGQATARREAARERYRSLIVVAENDCHLWAGPVDEDGYGIAGRDRIHRLIFRETKGPVPSGKMVCHTCDTPACCNPDHLYAGTALDNARDAMERGRLAVGTRNKASLLDEQAVREIRRRRRDEGASTATLAQAFGVSKPTIIRVLAGRSWGHIT